MLPGSALAGLVVGVAFSGDDLVSVQVWVGASAVTIVAVMVRDLALAASIEIPTVSPAWTLPSARKRRDGPLGLQNMGALLSSARTYPRAFERNVRPHLVALAEHYLTRRYGLDIAQDTSQVTALLDDVYWLIDPTINDRSPTRHELERFVDVVVGNDESKMLHIQRQGSATP
jgi:hypothetical protein